MAKQLYPFLQDHALVFIGYGGNDQSILEFVQNCPLPALAPPIYWVSKHEPPAKFSEWLRQRSALRVEHTDFDQLMLLIRNALGIELLDAKRWSQIGETYYESFERLKDEIEKGETTSDVSNALREATSTAQQSLPDERNYFSRARQNEKTNSDEAERIYREGLERFPKSSLLHRGYAIFFRDVRKDIEAASLHYKEALSIDPNKPELLASYAIFLEQNKHDIDTAEIYYKKALDIPPRSGLTLAFYADFLQTYRQQVDEAETYYKLAIDADPTNHYILDSYSRFLQNVRKDTQAAEIYAKRATEALK